MTSPTDKPLSHACIIMASGSGTRFGGNKLMANLAGMPLVEHVLRATEGHFAERVVVTRHADVAQLARKAGAQAVVHDLPLRNEAVALGMDALTCCDTVTFFQGDQPLVAARTIDALLAAAERDPGCIWRASFRGQPGAPVLFPAWAFDALRHLPPGKGGGYVAKAHPERVRTVEATSPWELFDIDTTDDLQKLQDHIAR
ncbi:nucleotidyltransferase family protein [uncultured Senegalimassilia sp.]|uniref:nucleotidyltransferase family protein n=1 Tax=uncultured Senegalimassilia sp. TaxID=1714350 RepID=UPI002671C10F|nr:nucleotidyltransferase family protein [uncultured Senegalimassilia sp.]